MPKETKNTQLKTAFYLFLARCLLSITNQNNKNRKQYSTLLANKFLLDEIKIANYLEQTPLKKEELLQFIKLWSKIKKVPNYIGFMLFLIFLDDARKDFYATTMANKIKTFSRKGLDELYHKNKFSDQYTFFFLEFFEKFTLGKEYKDEEIEESQSKNILKNTKEKDEEDLIIIVKDDYSKKEEITRHNKTSGIAELDFRLKKLDIKINKANIILKEINNDIFCSAKTYFLSKDQKKAIAFINLKKEHRTLIINEITTIGSKNITVFVIGAMVFIYTVYLNLEKIMKIFFTSLTDEEIKAFCRIAKPNIAFITNISLILASIYLTFFIYFKKSNSSFLYHYTEEFAILFSKYSEFLISKTSGLLVEITNKSNEAYTETSLTKIPNNIPGIEPKAEKHNRKYQRKMSFFGFSVDTLSTVSTTKKELSVVNKFIETVTKKQKITCPLKEVYALFNGNYLLYANLDELLSGFVTGVLKQRFELIFKTPIIVGSSGEQGIVYISKKNQINCTLQINDEKIAATIAFKAKYTSCEERVAIARFTIWDQEQQKIIQFLFPLYVYKSKDHMPPKSFKNNEFKFANFPFIPKFNDKSQTYSLCPKFLETRNQNASYLPHSSPNNLETKSTPTLYM